ncbi:hypothetical protein NN6n1_04970 [Shinella zoogloeoides]
MREEIEVLEHQVDILADLADIAHLAVQCNTIDRNLAFLMRFQTIEAADQRRLAGARETAGDDTLALANRQVDIRQHLEGAVPLGNVLRFDDLAAVHRTLLLA